jgi:hypothetical protein
MKVVRIQGGLGNQLFTLAFANSVALMTEDRVGLDIASFGADPYGRRFVIAALAETIGRFEVVRRPLLNSRPVRLLGRLARLGPYCAEGSPPTDLDGLRALISAGVYFDGYWQNEAFIAGSDGFRAAVAQSISDRATPQPALDVVLHYRTYKEEIRPKARSVPDIGYFRRALARIGEGLGRSPEVNLISDDPELARDRLAGLGVAIKPVAGTGPWDDLALLMRARNLILSNSSFSWWGGYCSNADRIFYPRRQNFTHYPQPAGRFICL